MERLPSQAVMPLTTGRSYELLVLCSLPFRSSLNIRVDAEHLGAPLCCSGRYLAWLLPCLPLLLLLLTAKISGADDRRTLLCVSVFYFCPVTVPVCPVAPWGTSTRGSTKPHSILSATRKILDNLQRASVFGTLLLPCSIENNSA